MRRTSGWSAKLVAALVALWIPIQNAWGQTTPAQRLDDEPVTSRMMALGGRAEALSSSTSAMFGNPAMLAAARAYHADAGILYDPTISRFSTIAAMVDSTRSLFSAGLSYVYNRVDAADGRRSGHDLRLDMALPLGNIVGVGARVRYVNVSMGPPVLANNSPLNDRPWDGFLFDAGIYVRPASFLTVSASGRNLNNPDSTAAPIGAAVSASVTPFPSLSLVADVLLDFRSVGTVRGRYSGGAEIFLGDHYALRAGYMFDDVRERAQAVTFGLGYLDEHFGIECSMRQGFIPASQTTLMLSLRYFYQPN